MKTSKVREALALMNSMILSGESHSETSHKAYEDAMSELYPKTASSHNSPLTGRVEMEELKPCPFCGSEDVGVSYGRKANDMPFPYIECMECAAMLAGEEDTELDARSMWNRRALESSLSRAQERLKEIANFVDMQITTAELSNDKMTLEEMDSWNTVHRLATEDEP